MKAARGNKEYTIDESQRKSYQDSGYDIKDDAGNVIAYGRGKSVPYSDYMELKAELERLQNGGDNLQNGGDNLHKEAADESRAAKKSKELKQEGGAK